MNPDGAHTENELFHFLPLLISIVCGGLVITSRIFTNRFVKKYQTQVARETSQKMKSSNDGGEKQKVFLEGADTISKNPPSGQIPILYSTIYLIGFLGLIVSFFWAFVSVGWWASAIIAGLYLFTGFIPSMLKAARR